MSNFTKGPWGYYLPDIIVNESYMSVEDASGKLICSRTVFNSNYKEHLANAKLIAAAPDLYEALDQAVTSMQDSGYHNDHIAVKAAKQALAKARGKL